MSSIKHVLVALETIHLPLPSFHAPSDAELEILSYPYTTVHTLIERIKPATILLTTTLPLTEAVLSEENCPNLKLIQVLGVGFEKVDVIAARKRGITVQNIPGANADSVSQHAIALYFALRRGLMGVALKTARGEWTKQGTLAPTMRDAKGLPPPGLGEEIACIVGFGDVGRKVATMLLALGVKVCVAESLSGNSSSVLTSATLDEAQPREPDLIQASQITTTAVPRTLLATALCTSTALFITCPLTDSTKNLISASSLAVMQSCAVVINVARGGVVDEKALASALIEGKIAGAGSDVFITEPADSSVSPLLQLNPEEVNFVGTPHVAWFSQQTMTNLVRILVSSVDSFMAGKPVHVVN